MIVTEVKRSIVLFTLVSLMNLTSATTTIGISVTEVKTGDPFSITCYVSDLSQDVVFKKGISTIGRCLASVAPGVLPGVCATGFSQDISTNITTYQVASANATVDEGSWTCEHQPETSNALSLVVYGFPANPIVDNQAYLPNSIDTTNVDSTQFTVNVSECVNPAPTVTWTFYQDCEGTSITTISIPSTTSEDPDVSCSSPYSAYKNYVTVRDMKKVVGGGDLCYKVRSLVGYPGTSFVNITVPFSQNITFTSKVSKEVDDKTVDAVKNDSLANLGGSVLSGGGSSQVLIHVPVTITAKQARLLFFSNQYLIGGTVVYGIQIVFVSTVINAITIIIGVVILAIYYEQVQCIAILYFVLLAAAASMLSVLIFMAIVYLFGHNDFIHIKFKNRKKSKNMSSLGLKLTKNDTINFSFKVKAINACMTLHVLENGETESISKSRKVKMVLGDGFPIRPVPENRVQNSSDSLICNIVSHTEYTSFRLNTESKHITLLNEQGGIILQWTCSAESFTVKDIEISNINQDDSTKDSSTEKEKEEKLDTPDEWIFWFRKGDTLCEIGEHEREIKEGLRCKQTVQLICVVIFPIAWLVMIVLMVKYLFKSKGKKADDNESEMSEQLNKKQKESSEQQNKKQKDTKGKWFDFIWFSCFHNSVKPHSTTDDNKPKAMMPGSYLANSPKGRNLPKLPEIVTQGDEIRKTKKKDKKKRKIKSQDSNMNDKQQSHCDKQDIIFQPEIAVAVDKLEAE